MKRFLRYFFHRIVLSKLNVIDEYDYIPVSVLHGNYFYKEVIPPWGFYDSVKFISFSNSIHGNKQFAVFLCVKNGVESIVLATLKPIVVFSVKKDV